MILRKYLVVFDVPAQLWELRKIGADQSVELVDRFTTREDAICGCKRYCGGLRCNGWVADLLAYDRNGNIAFEQLFEPGIAVG